jgi:hypothetical protein
MKTSCPFCGFENPLGADHCGQCLHSLMKRDIPASRRKGDVFQDALLNEPVSELLTGLDLLVCSPNDSLRENRQDISERQKRVRPGLQKQKNGGDPFQPGSTASDHGVHKLTSLGSKWKR